MDYRKPLLGWKRKNKRNNKYFKTQHSKPHLHVSLSHLCTCRPQCDMKTWRRDRQERTRDRARLSWLEKTHPPCPLCSPETNLCVGVYVSVCLCVCASVRMCAHVLCTTGGEIYLSWIEIKSVLCFVLFFIVCFFFSFAEFLLKLFIWLRNSRGTKECRLWH